MEEKILILFHIKVPKNYVENFRDYVDSIQSKYDFKDENVESYWLPNMEGDSWFECLNATICFEKNPNFYNEIILRCQDIIDQINSSK